MRFDTTVWITYDSNADIKIKSRLQKSYRWRLLCFRRKAQGPESFAMNTIFLSVKNSNVFVPDYPTNHANLSTMQRRQLNQSMRNPTQKNDLTYEEPPNKNDLHPQINNINNNNQLLKKILTCSCSTALKQKKKTCLQSAGT